MTPDFITTNKNFKTMFYSVSHRSRTSPPGYDLMEPAVALVGLNVSMHVFNSCSKPAHWPEPSPLAAQQFKRDDINTKHWLVDLESVSVSSFNLGSTGNDLVWATFLSKLVKPNPRDLASKSHGTGVVQGSGASLCHRSVVPPRAGPWPPRPVHSQETAPRDRFMDNDVVPFGHLQASLQGERHQSRGDNVSDSRLNVGPVYLVAYGTLDTSKYSLAFSSRPKPRKSESVSRLISDDNSRWSATISSSILLLSACSWCSNVWYWLMSATMIGLPSISKSSSGGLGLMSCGMMVSANASSSMKLTSFLWIGTSVWNGLAWSNARSCGFWSRRANLHMSVSRRSRIATKLLVSTESRFLYLWCTLSSLSKSRNTRYTRSISCHGVFKRSILSGRLFNAAVRLSAVPAPVSPNCRPRSIISWIRMSSLLMNPRFNEHSSSSFEWTSMKSSSEWVLGAVVGTLVEVSWGSFPTLPLERMSPSALS